MLTELLYLLVAADALNRYATQRDSYFDDSIELTESEYMVETEDETSTRMKEDM